MQVFLEMPMGLVMITLDGGLLEGAVHPLDLTVRPEVIRLGQAVIDVVFTAHAVEDVATCEQVLLTVGELNAVVGEQRVQLLGHGLDEIVEKLRRDQLRRPRVQFSVSKLAGAVDGYKQAELSLLGPDLGDVDVEIA